MIILARLLALLVLLGAPATAAASACEGGRYRIDGGIPLAGFEGDLGVVAVARNTVSMSPCGTATKSKVRRGKVEALGQGGLGQLRRDVQSDQVAYEDGPQLRSGDRKNSRKARFRTGEIFCAARLRVCD